MSRENNIKKKIAELKGIIHSLELQSSVNDSVDERIRFFEAEIKRLQEELKEIEDNER